MLPAGTPKLVLQAEQGVCLGGGVVGEEVPVCLRLCVGLLTNKCRSASLPKSAQTQKQAHCCRSHILLMQNSNSNILERTAVGIYLHSTRENDKH